MPNTRSAKKAMRQAQARRARNRTQLSALRTALKKVRSAPSTAEAQQALTRALRLLDRAAGKGLIHRNNAARRKARLVRLVRGKGGTV